MALLISDFAEMCKKEMPVKISEDRKLTEQDSQWLKAGTPPKIEKYPRNYAKTNVSL